VHSQEGLHHGDRNFGGLKWHDSAIATNDLVVGQHGGVFLCDTVVRDRRVTHGAGGVHRGLSCLHVFFLPGEQFNSANKKRCLDRFYEIQVDTISGVRQTAKTLRVVFW
jgi:hypothetical protein